MKKRLLAALLSAVLLTTGILPASAAETDDAPEQEIVIQDDEAAFEEYPTTPDLEPEESAESDTETVQSIDVGETDAAAQTETEYAVNPLYRDAVSESDLLEPQDEPSTARWSARSAVEGIDTYTEDETVIAGLIRDAMRDHAETVTFKVITPKYDATNSTRWVSLAMNETSSPIEGDYILWSYAGYSARISHFSDSKGEKCTYTITFTYYTTAEQESELSDKVDELLDSFAFTAETSDYTKIQTIYDYVCRHVTYDNENLNDDSYKLKFTAYAALLNGTAVCQGYSSLIYRMAKQEGIDARIIASTTHGWNIVRMDGLYYYLDATWDSKTPDYWRYFLCGEQCSTFSASSSHRRSDGSSAPDNSIALDYTSSEFYDAYPMGETDYISFRWSEETDGTYSCTAVCGRDEIPCTVTITSRTEPTCTAAGRIVCRADGEQSGTALHSEKTFSLPALDHSFTNYVSDDNATCTEDGTETASCDYGCGETDTRTKAGSATGVHLFTEYYYNNDATCTEDGTETASCDYGCGETDTRTKAGSATGVHLFTEYYYNNDATCTEDGTETASCDYGCGKTDTRTKQNSAFGHKWDTGIVTQAPTCGASGVMTYTCTRAGCQETKTEGIPPTGSHTYQQTGIIKATTSRNGTISKTCTVCGKTAAETISRPKTVTISSAVYTYSGKVKHPTVTVRDSKGNRIASANYTVSNLSGHKNVGTYKVTVKFKGTKYSGTMSTSFRINPKSTKLKSLTASSKGFTAKWSAVTTQTSGYQLQYSTSSKFTNAKTVSVSGSKTTSKKVSKLSAKKKYYVRVRTYKTVSGKKYYSAWSAAKTVTTKK